MIERLTSRRSATYAACGVVNRLLKRRGSLDSTGPIERTPQPPYSKVAVSGEIVAVSGQVPLDANGLLVSEDFRDQTLKVFANLEACLASVGCTLADVFKVTGYLSDFADLADYNEMYAACFPQPFPARTTVQVGLAGMKIEVEAWARLPNGRVGSETDGAIRKASPGDLSRGEAAADG